MKAINEYRIPGNPGVSDLGANGEDEVGPSEQMLWRFKGQRIRGGTGDLDLLQVHRVPALQHRDILYFVNQKLFGIVQTYYAALSGLFLISHGTLRKTWL